MDNARLHHAIVCSFLARKRPPSVDEVAAQFGCSRDRARAALRALADDHGAVLQPGSDEIWIVHPFSAAPTTCVVKSGDCAWWGNCAWCSLGLAYLAGGNATIETRTGAIGEHATIRIEDGRLLDSDYVVHFPIPMRRAWANVVYTCSVQLLFRDEAEVDAWCATRGIPKGDVRPIERIWNFARDWYGRHADAHWTKWSTQEAAELFARHGLDGPIWALSDDGGRF